MAKHHPKKKQQGISASTQILIALIVVLFIVGGGAGVANQFFGFLDLSRWHIGQHGDLTGLILGAGAVAIGLAILLWRRITGGVGNRWAAKIMGIQSLSDIYAMSPGQFEQFVGYLFQQQGYQVQVVGHSGDEGIDIELRRHNDHQRVVAQCKRYRGSVGQPIVREFYGSFANEAIEGYLVTTGEFTQPAREWAASRPLRLIDGTELMRWTESTARHMHYEALLPFQA